jgi:exopolyphosphatase/guanosine-5'-triphosphate,3'-diphosphate pyrophosphatase
VAKYASIDIGSNTLLLLITDDTGGTLRPIVDECDFGRLGQGLAHSNNLHPDAVARSLEVVRRYRTLMDAHELAGVACVGTQALREAENRDVFVGPAEEILGCTIEIIAGEREAELVATAVIKDFPERCQDELLCVDVGGASTEFIRIRGGELVSVVSLPIGAVRLSEAFLTSDPPTATETKNLYEAISAQLATLELPEKAQLVGSAGTATSIASIALALEQYDPIQIHGYELSRKVVGSVAQSLLSTTVADKRQLTGLAPKRADVIAGGVAIYDRVMQELGASAMLVSDRGVRWGLAYELAS